MNERKCPVCGEAMHDGQFEWTCPQCYTHYNLGVIPYADRLQKRVEELTDWTDLMVDEFKRIKSCPGVTSEIVGLCERAITNTKQHVPVIEQRDDQIMKNDILRAMNLDQEDKIKELVAENAELRKLKETKP